MRVLETLVEAKAMSGHFGRDKTVALIQSKVYFPGFRQKTIDYIKSCVACQCVKCGGKFEKCGEKLKSIPVPRMPMRQLGIDCITNLPKTEEGYDTIVTAIDYPSKWPESKPLKGKFAEGVASSCMSLSCHHGAAKIPISDQGREFVNQVCVISHSYTVYMYIFIIVYDRDYFCVRPRIFVLFNLFLFFFLLLYSKVADKFYELTKIRHNITSTYHPQANGEVGRFNRTTQKAFLKCQEFHDEVTKAEPCGTRSCTASSSPTEPENMPPLGSVPTWYCMGENVSCHGSLKVI